MQTPTVENLISLVKKGFFQVNLSELLTMCEELLQTKKNTLVIFTLQGVFWKLYCFYDVGPVEFRKRMY